MMPLNHHYCPGDLEPVGWRGRDVFFFSPISRHIPFLFISVLISFLLFAFLLLSPFNGAFSF